MDIVREMTGKDFLGSSTVGMWGSQAGYTIVNFIFLYCLGGYIRKYGFPIKRSSSILLGVFASVLCIFFMRILETKIDVIGEPVSTSYLSPFVILLAILCFELFRRIEIKNKIINKLAGAALTCFLFHLIIIKRVCIEFHACSGILVMLAHLSVCVIGIYLISYVLYRLYTFCVSPLTKYLDRFSVSYEDDEMFLIKRNNS